jgi:hypothetical protein
VHIVRVLGVRAAWGWETLGPLALSNLRSFTGRPTIPWIRTPAATTNPNLAFELTRKLTAERIRVVHVGAQARKLSVSLTRPHRKPEEHPVRYYK